MVKVASYLNEFLSFLESKQMFFGRDYLTSYVLLTMYLEYDTSNNFLRNAILERTVKSNKDINSDVFELITNCKEVKSNTKIEKFNYDIKFSTELSKVIFNIFNNENIELLSCKKFIKEVFFDDEHLFKTISEFLVNGFGVSNVDELKEAFENSYEDIEKEYFEISDEVKPYISKINGNLEENKYQCKSSYAVKSFCWVELLKKKKNKIAIVGSNAIGKKPIIYDMAYDIAHGNAPTEFNNYTIIKVDLLRIISGTADKTVLEKRVKKVKEFLENKENTIIFIDNFYILGYEDSFSEILYYLFLPILLSSKFKIITTLPTECIVIIKDDPKMTKALTCMSMFGPPKEDLQAAIKPTIYSLTFYHGVIISNSIFKMAVMFAQTFGASLDSDKLFNSIKDLIDFSMVHARQKERTYVNEEDIRFMYHTLFEAYEKLSDVNKTMTAIHEAGHYVVKRFCGELKGISVSLVTIIPQGNFGGFNLLDFDEGKFETDSYEFYLQNIAVALGGRAAEEIFARQISSGASADLQYATEIAYNLISNLSLNKKNGKQEVKANENLMSEASLNRVDRKANKIIKEAYKISKSILINHQDYVIGLANLLLEKQVVTHAEIHKHEMKVGGHFIWVKNP